MKSFVHAAPAGRESAVKVTRAELAPHAAAAPVAIIVCHGMGQQVPFETIDGVARLLRKEVRREAVPPLDEGEPTITTRIIDVDGEKIARAELGADGAATVPVHIYETYWAPLTAGKVNLGDVFGFLKDAGTCGIINSFRTFDRFMFHDWQSFRVPGLATAAKFLGVLLVFLSLALMSVTIVAVGAARALTRGASNWPSDLLMADLTSDFAMFGIPAFLLGILYFAAWLRERERNQRNDGLDPGAGGGLLNLAISIVLRVTLLAAVATGLSVLWHLLTVQAGGAGWHWDTRLSRLAVDESWGATVIIGIWAIVFYLNNKARGLLVDFMGDVTAYIAAHTANKFYEVRQGIQKRAKTIARAVYTATDGTGGPLLYSRVIVMGHSLGSVVAYDMINALLLDEEFASGAATDVRARTSHLITFGSPLDKTAFIFREQQPRDSQVRESLAANVQPLIMDYDNRDKLCWLNLWSKHDPISGPLDFYDVADRAAHPNACPVLNLEDRYSDIPLFAHTMYWQSPCLGAALLAAVQDRPCADAVKSKGCAA